MTTESVIKAVAGIVERAIQIISGPPSSPIDTQMWFDKVSGELAIQANGVKNPLRTRVLTSDPAPAADGESWVNSTTNQFKYKIGGSVFSIDMGTSSTPANPAGDYYAVLSEDELSQLSNLGLLYPNYLIDSFNSVDAEATYTNAAAQASALRLLPGELSGKAVYEQESSTFATAVDGIAVITPNAFQLLTYVDNLDNTANVTISGDCSGFFADLKPILILKRIVQNGANAAVYVIGSDNNLGVFNVIGAPTVAGGNTTLKINIAPAPGSGHIDVLGQLNVAATSVLLYPLDITVKVGGAGALGSQNTIAPTDAHGLQTIRSLGGDPLHDITPEIVSNVDKIVAKKSPSGQFGIVGVLKLLAAPTADFLELNVYYTIDSFATLQKMTFTRPTSTNLTGLDQSDANDGGILYFFEENHIHVSDSGKFVMASPTQAFSGLARHWLGYGNLLDATPTLTAVPGATSDGPGFLVNSSLSNHWTCVGLTMDPSDNYVTARISKYNTGIAVDGWFSNGGATLLGYSDEAYYSGQGGPVLYGWYPSLEGTLQVVAIDIANNNDLPQFMKKDIASILAARPFTIHPEDYRFNPMFANNSVSEPISAEGSCFLMNSSFGSDNKIRSMWWSDSNDRTFMTVVHLEDVFVGTDEQQLVSFSAVPAVGQWSLTFGPDTTSALGFSATASQVQTALQALAGIGSGNVLVTGNYTSGFTVHFTGTLGKAPQSLMIEASDTLEDSGSNPVTITIAETVPGVVPVYPHLNNQYRHLNAGVGDLIMIGGNRQEGNYTTDAGLFTSNATGFWTYAQRRFKLHPTDPTRAFMAFPWYNAQDSLHTTGAYFMQLDHLDTFQGMFNNNDNGVPAGMAIGATLSANNGTEIATMVTADRNIALRALTVQAIGTWANYPFMKARSLGQYLRCKLVNVSGGLPNEASTIETSSTKISLFDIYNGTSSFWTPFRFNSTNLTNGQQFYIVMFVDGVNPATDWVVGAAEPGGGTEIELYGAASGGTSAYKQAGIWVASAFNMNYRLYDYMYEEVKTPEMALYGAFDLLTPETYKSSIRETQLEYNQAKNKLMLTYTLRGNINGDQALYTQGSTVAYRTFNIPAADTWVTDQNVGNATQFLGYDNSTFDPNMVLQARLSDPLYPKLDRYGKQHYADGGHTQAIRGIDVAGGSGLNWTNGNLFNSNSVISGHTQDSRFKSGWATKFALQGNFQWYLGHSAYIAHDNFIFEMEMAPAAADLAGGTVIATCGNSSGWYLQFNASGQLGFFIVNTNGPTYVSGSLTQASTVFNVNEYARIRVTKSDDNFIRMYRWRNITEGWVEMTYSTQTNTAGKTVMVAEALPFYIGGYYNNADLVAGLIGEVKYAIGTNVWKNGDAIIDRRPIYETHNLGDRVFAKSLINQAPAPVNGDGSADSYNAVLSQGVVMVPGSTSGKIALEDQMLSYTNNAIPQGKLLAATIELDAVSAADQPAVQGFLLNFIKQ